METSGAEFNLLTPSAVILADNAYPYPPETIASLSRVQWGKEHSHDYQRQTLRCVCPWDIQVDCAADLLRFFIVNDGSPIDFSVSHGSHGAGWRQGRAEAIIENVRAPSLSFVRPPWTGVFLTFLTVGTQERYLNDVITDDVWNTVWYFGAPVGLTPESLRLSNRSTGYSWDDILDVYLHEAATQVSTAGE